MQAPLFFGCTLLAVFLATEANAQVQRKAPVVAIIDTGVDITHPYLNARLWRNPGESGVDSNGADKSHNGIDDDGNGYIDDVYGWNFASKNTDVRDHHGHGTHVAGIIHGLAPEAELMILKYYDPQATGLENLSGLLGALDYALQMHADIINLSGGGEEPNALERALIAKAARMDIPLIAAAGNEGADSDQRPFYPADYKLPNVLSVGAHGRAPRLLASSNFGSGSVTVAAPGWQVLSSLPGGTWGPMTGTSQAAAEVTGALCALMSQRPDMRRASQLFPQLEAATIFEPTLLKQVATAGRVDLTRTLALQERGRSFSGFHILPSATAFRPLGDPLE